MLNCSIVPLQARLAWRNAIGWFGTSNGVTPSQGEMREQAFS